VVVGTAPVMYQAAVDTNGSWLIRRSETEQLMTSSSKEIKTGTSNHIAFECIRVENAVVLRLFVNGSLMGQAADVSPKSPLGRDRTEAAVLAYSFGSSDVAVAFRNFGVRALQ